MNHHGHDCGLTPGEIAQVDQNAAGYNEGVTKLTLVASRLYDRGSDQVHTASSLAISLMVTHTPSRMASLCAFAITRLAEQLRAEMCPCLPDAPKHEHLTGGYALTGEERSGVEWRIAHGQPAWPDGARP